MNFGDYFKRFEQRRDQILTQVRDEYTAMDNDGRRAFRAWVEGVAAPGHPPVHQTGRNISVSIILQVMGAEGPESVALSPRTIARAVAAWDDDEPYIHDEAEF